MAVGVMSALATLDRARLTVTHGSMGAMARRLVAALAVEADLGIDRVDEAALVMDLLSAASTEVQRDGRLEVVVAVSPGVLELRVGPCRPGHAARLLDVVAVNAGRDVVRALASSVEIREHRSRAQVLKVVLAAPRTVG